MADRRAPAADAAADAAKDPVEAADDGTAEATAAATRPARRAPASLLRASAVMASGTAVSRLLGFVRTFVLIAAVGATLPAADAFTTANTVPNNLYLLIAGGVLNAVIVPQVVRAATRPDGGADYLDRLVTAAVLAFAAVTAVLVAAAPLLVWLYADSYPPPLRALTVAFALWCLPQVFFYALYTLLGQVLNARGSFGPYMWAPVVNNVVAIAGLVAFVLLHGGASGVPGVDAHPVGSWTPAKVALLAGTATAGIVAQALVLLVPLRRAGVRLRPRFGVRGLGLGAAGRVAGWTFAGVLAGQLAFLVLARVANGARVDALGDPGGTATAGLTAWSVSYLVFMLPHSLVAVSLVTALFTRMSRAAADGQQRSVAADASRGLRVLGVANVLAVTGLVTLAPLVGRVVVTGPPEAGAAVGRVIAVLALGLVPFSASYLLQRAFYAFEDARTPFLVQLVAVAVWAAGTAVSGALLDPRSALVGAAGSMAAGQLAAAVLAGVLLHRRLGGLDVRGVLATHARLLVAAGVAAACGLGAVALAGPVVPPGRAGALVLVVLGGVAVVAAYVLACALLRVPELRPLVARLRGRRTGS